MRILYAVPGYKPAYRMGGPILSVAAKAETLVKKGHDVTVVTTNANLDQDLDVPLDQPVPVNGVQVWYCRHSRLLRRGLPFLSRRSQPALYYYAPRMAAHLERIAPAADLVHTHIPFVYPTYAAARAARRWGKPLFYHQRGVFDPGGLRFRSLKKTLYLALFERSILRQVNTLIALTKAEEADYRALGIDRPCRVLSNGIDVAAYRRLPAPGWSRWDLPPAAPVVLYLGRLHPRKGADTLLEAFLRIHSRFPDAVLVMAGPDEGRLEAGFRQKARQSGAERRVVFAGMVTGEDKLNLLARADLFCLPSKAEAFSMAVLEALASGTPVLLSAGCHFPEVQSAGAGRITTDEAGGVASTLAELLAAPQELRRMGQRGVDFVRRQYDWDHITDRLIEIYKEGISRAGEKPASAPRRQRAA
jgi:glycosyltransferase involved in cell wall biosynthesis